MKKIKIVTKRLILREFLTNDWKYVHEYASERKTVKYLPWGPETPKQVQTFIRFIRRTARKKPRRQYELVIVLKSDNRIIGGCGIRIRNEGQREGDIGYVLNRRYWNKGYVTEAAKAAIHFGFSKLKLHRIWATCDVRNKASMRVLEKAGMKREGLLRKNVFQKGSWRDSYLYAILEPKHKSRH